MLKKIKILHVASFHGNIGDNVSHIGFENILSMLELDYCIDRLEIRKAYNNYKEDDAFSFDENFVEKANGYDFLVFGGGGFLDYWVKGSPNGTTVSIHEYDLDKIKTNILFTSIGANPNKIVPEENYEKFKSFLNYIKSKDNITLALRNDASVLSIENDFGKELLEDTFEILDHGFFYEKLGIEETSFPVNGKYICVNVTQDQLDFKNSKEEGVSHQYYYENVAEMLKEIYQEYGYKIVFVPHIYTDINAIYKVLENFSDQFNRDNVYISPYIQGDEGCHLLASIYKKSEAVIASRYHANILALNFGVPSFGLSPLRRVHYLYEFFNMPYSSSYVEPGFKDKVLTFLRNNRIVEKNNIEYKRSLTLDFYRKYFGC